MTLTIVVGVQWGDEGKGRIVDWFAAGADYSARYNGGDNAGHTVTVGSQIYKLHIIPSGIIHPQVTAILGNGMVVNLHTLLDEMEMLRKGGVKVDSSRLRISFAAHLITPAHQALDKVQEAARGKGNIGTTGRGIGPAYTDKASRRGLRAADMLTPDFGERISEHAAETNRLLGMLGAPLLDPLQVSDEYLQYAGLLKDLVADTSLELDEALKTGKSVLVEGAQGTLLDIDHGTYPFVTSSSTTAPGALTGLGLGLDAAKGARVVGVVKAFQTRVGSGPFPTEVSGDLAIRLRGTGANPWDEYGTTTGRPRRVGWLDGVLLRHAARINGLGELAVTKLDILSGLETLRVCVAYEKDGMKVKDTPLGATEMLGFQPVYEDLPGWMEDVGSARKWSDLPAAARSYLERIADLCGVQVRLVSVGPERSQLISI